jgi:hypothetical protein
MAFSVICCGGGYDCCFPCLLRPQIGFASSSTWEPSTWGIARDGRGSGKGLWLLFSWWRPFCVPLSGLWGSSSGPGRSEYVQDAAPAWTLVPCSSLVAIGEGEYLRNGSGGSQAFPRLVRAFPRPRYAKAFAQIQGPNESLPWRVSSGHAHEGWPGLGVAGILDLFCDGLRLTPCRSKHRAEHADFLPAKLRFGE